MMQYIFGAGVVLGTYIGYKVGKVSKGNAIVEKFRDIAIATRVKMRDDEREKSQKNS